MRTGLDEPSKTFRNIGLVRKERERQVGRGSYPLALLATLAGLTSPSRRRNATTGDQPVRRSVCYPFDAVS
jgi:hypothetical protein